MTVEAVGDVKIADYVKPHGMDVKSVGDANTHDGTEPIGVTDDGS